MKLPVSLSLLALAAAPVVQGEDSLIGKNHTFWVNVVDGDGENQKEVLVAYSDNGLPDVEVFQYLKMLPKELIEIYALRLGKGNLRTTEDQMKQYLDWGWEDDHIKAYLPAEYLEDVNSGSILVGGKLEFGCGQLCGSLGADQIVHEFTSDQLLLNNNMKMAADLSRKVSNKLEDKGPFRAMMKGCGSKIIVTVYGLTSDIISNIPSIIPSDTPNDVTPNNISNVTSVCIYDLGGKEIGCNDLWSLEKDGENSVFATFTHEDVGMKLPMDTTIFARVIAMFNSPELGSAGTKKVATVSADYKATCEENSF